MELVKVNNNGKLITELKVVCEVYGKNTRMYYVLLGILSGIYLA